MGVVVGVPTVGSESGAAESDPRTVLEGLAIVGSAVEAERVFLLEIGGGVHPRVATVDGMEIEIVPGLPAAVLSEDSALVAALEGRRPMPSPPWIPARRLELFGAPCVVIRAETAARVAAVLEAGVERYLAEHGRTAATRPADGCGGARPADGSDSPATTGAAACAVDLARQSMAFIETESCGRCVVCREGTMQMAEILGDICGGRGRAGDVDLLVLLAETLAATGPCGWGRASAAPVLTTIRDFRAEYDAHLMGEGCPPGVCSVGGAG